MSSEVVHSRQCPHDFAGKRSPPFRRPDFASTPRITASWRKTLAPCLRKPRHGAMGVGGFRDLDVFVPAEFGPSSTTLVLEKALGRNLLVGGRGLEPRTNGLRVRCSTN